ncbi:MAG: hypothetical protein CMO55_00765 [Verrucomicrobiales bacterium]|nr:hypothetical protein [Verrucomicrobiales bacterium]
MPHRWIAERLQLRSPANSSRTVRNFDKIADRQLSKDIRTWENAYFFGCPFPHTLPSKILPCRAKRSEPV